MPDFPAILLASTHGAAHISLILLLIFGTAKVFAEICERMGQPGIIGEILAGVLLGPSILNWIHPDQVLSALAEMGAMFLLFRVGLEVKPSELLKVGGTALLVAVLGVALPFFAGWVILAYFGASRIESIFVGAAMVATSVGITARVLAARGLLQERASKIILAAAVIDDVLGLLVLALVSSLARDQVHLAGLAATAFLAFGFTYIVARFGARVFQRVVPKIESKLSVKEAQFNLALILLFALSLLAVYIGVAAIVGAFLAGIAFSETADHRVHDLVHGSTELLVPFFLAGIGLRLHIADFAGGSIMLISIILLIAAVLTKLIGCGLGALALGRTDALRVGVGMVPRGEVGMVVAQIGLALGVIERPIYAVVVFMAIGTTLLAPPFLSYAFRHSAAATHSEEFTLG